MVYHVFDSCKHLLYFHCILVIVFSTNLLWNLINLTWFKLSYFFCQDYAEKPTFLNFSTTAFSQGQQLHFSLKNFYVCTLSLLSLSQKYKEESKDYFVIHARHGSKSNVSPTHSRIKKIFHWGPTVHRLFMPMLSLRKSASLKSHRPKFWYCCLWASTICLRSRMSPLCREQGTTSYNQ